MLGGEGAALGYLFSVNRLERRRQGNVARGTFGWGPESKSFLLPNTPSFARDATLSYHAI